MRSTADFLFVLESLSREQLPVNIFSKDFNMLLFLHDDVVVFRFLEIVLYLLHRNL